MNVIGYIQQGEFSEYKGKIQQEGMPVRFRKGTDVVPFLRKHHQAFYIVSGKLYLRLAKADGSYTQLMAFDKGSMFPLYDMKEEFWYSEVKMLVAARGEVMGYTIPIETYYSWKQEDRHFAELLNRQLAKTAAYLSVSHILYRDGECITRVCNLMYHAYYYRKQHPDTLLMGQEELAGIVNSSKSQVKRALMQLRKEGGIVMQCRKTVITDIAVIERHVSENIRTEERRA